jgi:Family of unknown function (DUF6370)
MKQILVIITLNILTFCVKAQDKKESPTPQIVEASCGECNFGLKGKSCDLAVRIDGKAYFVDGTKIDDHGDAHAKNGFCEVIRKAEVVGEIVGDRFKAISFKLLPEEKDKKKHHNLNTTN